MLNFYDVNPVLDILDLFQDNCRDMVDGVPVCVQDRVYQVSYDIDNAAYEVSYPDFMDQRLYRLIENG